MHSMPIGGAEKVLLDILRNFDYSKYQVELLLYTHSGENLCNVPSQVVVKSVFQPDSPTLWNRIRSKLVRMTGLINRIEQKATLKVVGNQQYDTIISFCQGPAHKIHTFLLGKARRHLSWIHSDLSVSNWGLLFFDGDIHKQCAAYGQMDEIIFVSQGAMQAFNRVFPSLVPSVKERVIYNIVDVLDIQTRSKVGIPYVCDSNRFVFINSGRLVDAKCQSRLVDCAEILRQKGLNFEIWILGDGPLKGALKSQIETKQLTDCVKLFGAVSNPYPYIQAADCFVLTSCQEGFPIVICEALALAKPIVSTRVTGPTELLGETDAGILVDEDITQIAEAMYRVATQPVLRTEYAARALQRCDMFDVKHSMDEIYRAID